MNYNPQMYYLNLISHLEFLAHSPVMNIHKMFVPYLLLNLESLEQSLKLCSNKMYNTNL